MSALLSACGGGASPDSAAGTSNRAPVAVNDVALQNGAALNITVLINDRDPDGDTISLDTVSSASNGTVIIDTNGTPDAGDDFVTYTPNGGYGGNDSFSYSISDPFGLGATATVSIVASSTAPVANSDDATTPADTPVSVFVLANDSDPNGLALSLVSVTTPSNGVASINDNGTPGDASDDYVDYGPNGGFSGSDSFSYTISNGAESASASVNIIVGGTGSAGVSGDVTKGPISGAIIKLYRIDGSGMPSGAPVAQTATNPQGKWTVAVPLPREPLLVVSEGGQYVDETDSNPDISMRRVIQLDPTDQLEAVMPEADNYLSLNLYTNAMLLKSRQETVGNEFSQVYAANRSLMTQAAGFDPITTAPTDPGNPNPAASDVSKQYALLLGGAANALNAVIQGTGQNAVAFNVLGGFIADMQDCRLDGINQDGPAQYLFLGAQRNMPMDINLNLEITRFRNNNFANYNGISASLDQDACSQSGAVPDTFAPVITLLGANPLTFEGGGVYTDAGFSALDDRDGDVTANVSVSGSINTTSLTPQTLTFSVSDTAGNAGTATRTVNVVDTTPPVLTLNGTTPVDVLINTSYTDSLGASATDAVDGDLTSSIVSVNPVDINTAGTYTITYDITDATGNAATQITRVVNVVNTFNPVITLNGNSPQTVEAGTPYVDAGASANDAPDGDITASIVVVNNVNTAAVGSYAVTYDVTDSDGNPATQVIRTVDVVDSTLPVISLNGANPQVIEAPNAYVELGATASDSFDGDISASLVVDASAVDTSTPGSYSVTYDVTDSNGNVAPTVTRTVLVQDTTAPVITLTGANPQTLEANTAYTELGATASDSLDGDITASIVIDTTAVDPSTPGSYVVTYDVSDGAGNAATQITRTVDVVDTTPPVITLTGANPQVIEALTAYTELGATANDSADGDVTASLVIDASAVDTSTPGSYSVTYDVSDAAGNAATQVTRTVTVQDTTAPIITLTGANPQVIEAPTAYTELGATASDNLDGDISASIVIDASAVDTSTPGSYVVTYDVTDAAGNAATLVTRTVTVQDTTAPVITLTGANPQVIEAPTAYTELGATANDAVDGNVSASIVIDASAVDTSTPGSYVVTYDVTDAAGNAATQVTRTVTVQDTTAPVITLLGSNPVDVGQDSVYSDAGATASDTLDGDLSASVVIDDSAVDTSVPGTYVVNFSVSDAAGNPASATRTVNVLAGTNYVASVSPPDGATGVAYATNIQVVFNEAMNAATITSGNLVLSTSPSGVPAVATAVSWNAGALTATVNPAADLDPGVTYYVIVRSTVENAALQPQGFDVMTSFTTLPDTTPPVITLSGANPQVIDFGSAYVELGATASDNVDGDLSASIVIDASAVNTSAIGSYVVTYDVSDTSGNAATTVTRTVDVQDISAPVITLTGANPQDIIQDDPYVELGATATDNLDGDVSASIVIDASAVDTAVPGNYLVTYTVSDATSNSAVESRTVRVLDVTPPVLTLLGTTPLVFEGGSPYVDAGATATDNTDGDITASISVSGSVNVNAVGTYTLTYNVADSSGNAATPITRDVQVVDTTPPVISIYGPDPTLMAQNGPYYELGAQALDAVEGDISGLLVIDASAVDMATLGTYVVTYDVSDGQGNAATQVTRNVQVIVPPANAIDNDGDGVPDYIEVAAGGEPGLPASNVRNVAAGATNASLGSIPNGPAANDPTYVLYDSNTPVAPSNNWALDLTVPCRNIVFWGSLDSGQYTTLEGSAPTTDFAVNNQRVVLADGCQNIQFHNIGVTGATDRAFETKAGSETRMENVRIYGNSGGNGAAISVDDATLTLNNSVISDNDSTGDGVLWLKGPGSVFTIENSIITGNSSSGDGGAIFLDSTSAGGIIRNNLIYGNRANAGGAIAANSPSGTMVVNNTISANRATKTPGGGGGGGFALISAGPITLQDNIFWFNKDSLDALSSYNDSGSTGDPVTAAMSSFNLLTRSPVGTGDINIFATGPGWQAGYYLNQGSSPAVDSGSGPSSTVGLDTRYTDASGTTTDLGTVDRGFHFATANIGPADSYEELAATPNQIILPNGSNKRLIIRPLKGGSVLGRGLLVTATIEGPNANLVALSSEANVDPLNDGESILLTDMGNGVYEARISATGSVAVDTPVPLRINVDGVPLPILFNISRRP